MRVTGSTAALACRRCETFPRTKALFLHSLFARTQLSCKAAAQKAIAVRSYRDLRLFDRSAVSIGNSPSPAAGFALPVSEL